MFGEGPEHFQANACQAPQDSPDEMQSFFIF
jgi:hypothetical protein